MDIENAISQFLRSREAMGCTAHTMETYNREQGGLFRKWLHLQDVRDTEQFTAQLLTEYLAWYRDRGVSTNTLVSIRRRIATFITWCGVMGYAQPDLMAKVPKPRASQFIRRVHTEQEVHRILETASDQRLYHPFDGQELVAILLLLLDTGLRKSELAKLNVGDLDGELMQIRGKGEKDRLIMISTPTRQALDAYLKLRTSLHPEQPLFLNRGYGRNHHLRGCRVTGSAIYQRLRRLGQAAGVATSPHRWRHTFAFLAVKNGANLKALQLFLGHSSLTTTDNYLRGFGFQDAAREHKVFSPVGAMMRH